MPAGAFDAHQYCGGVRARTSDMFGVMLVVCMGLSEGCLASVLVILHSTRHVRVHTGVVVVWCSSQCACGLVGAALLLHSAHVQTALCAAPSLFLWAVSTDRL
jgi:hypothetical protein